MVVSRVFFFCEWEERSGEQSCFLLSRGGGDKLGVAQDDEIFSFFAMAASFLGLYTLISVIFLNKQRFSHRQVGRLRGGLK